MKLSRQVRQRLENYQFFRKLLKRLGLKFHRSQSFGTDRYLRHTQRRLEHLASLRLDTREKSVLEVGAGLGDHTSFWLDRDCTVLSTDARQENLTVLRSRYPSLQTAFLDMDNPTGSNPLGEKAFQIVYCYGLLYHLEKPAEALAFLARHCSELLLLETCVSFGEEESVNLLREPAEEPVNSVWGWGCRPTRPWVFNQLQKHFEYVYMPVTQPNHEEFPRDWSREVMPASGLVRAVFVASRADLRNACLVREVPARQKRHG